MLVGFSRDEPGNRLPPFAEHKPKHSWFSMLSTLRCRRLSVGVCFSLLIISLMMIAWALLLTNTGNFHSPSAGPTQVRFMDVKAKTERVRTSVTVPEEHDKSSCRHLVNSQSGLTQPSLALGKAWQAFTSDSGLANMEYCLVRCDLNACCPNSSLRGLMWLDIVKDDLRAGAEGDVTLVTQGTIDRLENMHLINYTWFGPKIVVFTVYNTSTASIKLANAQRTAIIRAAEAWKNVRVIICVMHEPEDYFTRRFASFKQVLLPVNTLRNIGMDNALTNYIFPLDIDFIPSRHLYDKLVRTYIPVADKIDRVVMVVPHWETLRCDGSVSVPVTFPELDRQAQRGIARPFHVATAHLIPLDWPPATAVCDDDGTTIWTPGIKTTNYFRWYRESRDGHEGLYPLGTGGGPTIDRYYEPFAIFRRVEADGRRLPRYPEQFVGRFKNKIAFISILRSHYYQFYAVRREFVVHVPSNQTSPDMQGLLLLMRSQHAQERAQLQADVYLPTGSDHPGAPVSGPWDQGFACRNA